MNDISGVIQTWLMRAIFWCAFSAFASNPSISFGAAIARSHCGDSEPGGAKLSFPSGPERETQPGAEAPAWVPQQDSRNFNGIWTFTSAGCPSSGFDVAEEGFDLAPDRLGLSRQLAGRVQNLMGRGAGLAGGLLYA